MEIDFSDVGMMPISWGKCPSCRWDHNPESKCPLVLSPDEEEEDEQFYRVGGEE